MQVPQGNQVKTQGETSEEANAANTLVTDFQLPERGENKCLSLKPPSRGSFVMVALAN